MWIEFCLVLRPINPPFSLKTQKVVCGDCWSTEGRLLLCPLPEGSSMLSVNKRPFKIPARDRMDPLPHHYGRIPSLCFFHLIPTRWFLYLPHWLPKLETWLKMNWLKFNPVKMNAQDWSTIEAGRNSPTQIPSSCSFRGQKVTIVRQSMEMANFKGLWIKPSEFKSGCIE